MGCICFDTPCIFVLNILNSAPVQSCELDPILTARLHENLDILLLTVTNIINTSLNYHWHCSTCSEDCRRQACVEKAIIWQESSEKLPSHPYPSISVQHPWKSRSSQHSLPSPRNQPQESACRAGHSTKIGLLRVVNDILSALDDDNISVLLFLDLCEMDGRRNYWPPDSHLPPDTCFGHSVCCTRLYLSDKYKSTSVNNSSQLMCGVPQGSVLGSVLFVVYTTPRSHWYHC